MNEEELTYRIPNNQIHISKEKDEDCLIWISSKAINMSNTIDELQQQVKKQKEVIDDCKEDISNLLDIINKNCNELKCTSDEWLVIQKYQDKEVSEWVYMKQV